MAPRCSRKGALSGSGSGICGLLSGAACTYSVSGGATIAMTVTSHASGSGARWEIIADAIRYRFEGDAE